MTSIARSSSSVPRSNAATAAARWSCATARSAVSSSPRRERTRTSGTHSRQRRSRPPSRRASAEPRRRTRARAWETISEAPGPPVTWRPTRPSGPCTVRSTSEIHSGPRRPPMPDAPITSDPAKRHSAALTDGPDRAAARSMLNAVGFTDEDLAKPLVAVATTWTETMPCNYNQRRLAEHVKDGIRAAGGTPMEFNTISISDGVTMGTEGMKTSLISREVIADSIELVVRGHMFDGIVALVACDKTIPGAAMALLRLNIPGVVLYGGTIMPGPNNSTVQT